MGTFKIEGGIKLKGEISPQGAKNEALQILCAVLLTPEKVTINNIPDITFWYQRYYYYRRFDEGIKMDSESKND